VTASGATDGEIRADAGERLEHLVLGIVETG
jgi:hypothetical protein